MLRPMLPALTTQSVPGESAQPVTVMMPETVAASAGLSIVPNGRVAAAAPITIVFVPITALRPAGSYATAYSTEGAPSRPASSDASTTVPQPALVHEAPLENNASTSDRTPGTTGAIVTKIFPAVGPERI